MYTTRQVSSQDKRTLFPIFKAFSIEDKSLINTYVDDIPTPSCEYSFANLFCWQAVHNSSWTLYKDRLLIYDNATDCTFMPIGEDLSPEELSILSINLKNMGFSPDFCFVNNEYLEKYPSIQNYFRVEQQRDFAEYIYDVNNLSLLQGKKLHKKRNLIAQFKRSFPQYEIRPLVGDIRNSALNFSRELVRNRKRPSKTLVHELQAIENAFAYFDELQLEGLAVVVDDSLVAFSVFSELGSDTFNVHFEKSDIAFKGAAQLINQETAMFLKDRCRYLNREQDLGIKGLRQAKMSYEPIRLLEPCRLIFSPSN